MARRNFSSKNIGFIQGFIGMGGLILLAIPLTLILALPFIPVIIIAIMGTLLMRR